MPKGLSTAITVRLIIIALLLIALFIFSHRPTLALIIDAHAWATTSSEVISEERQRLTAMHESGHVVTAMALKGPAALHSVRVYTRVKLDSGDALLGESDTDISVNATSRAETLNDAAVFYAGGLGENILLGKDSDSSVSDRKSAATVIAMRIGGPSDAERGIVAMRTNEDVVAFMRDVQAATNCATATVTANAGVIRELGNEIMRHPGHFNRRHLSGDELRDYFVAHPVAKPSSACDF